MLTNLQPLLRLRRYILCLGEDESYGSYVCPQQNIEVRAATNRDQISVQKGSALGFESSVIYMCQ